MLFSLSFVASAQDGPGKVYQHTQLMGIGGTWSRHIKGIMSNGQPGGIIDSWDQYGFAINHTVGVNLNKHFGVGIKTGFNSYSVSGGHGNYMFIPVMVDVMAYLSPRVNTFYGNADFGYGFGLTDHNADKSAKGGTVFNGAVGYRFHGSGKAAFTAAFGAIIKQHIGINNSFVYDKKPLISALTIALGIQF